MTDTENKKCQQCNHSLISFNGKWVHMLVVESEVQASGKTYPLVHKTINCFHEVNGKQCKCRNPELAKPQGGKK